MRFNFFSKYFPTPEYLRPRHVGLSFSDSNIRAILFDGTKERPTLKSIIVPLEKGIITDGSISDSEKIVEKLKIIKKSFDIPFVFFTVPDELVYIFSASVPTNPKGDLTESISFIMEENVPLPLSDLVFDFYPTKINKEGDEYKASVVVFACSKKEIEKYLEVLKKSEFVPVGCIHESQAIARSIIPQKMSSTTCLVCARKEKIGIYLVKNGIVDFSTIRNVSANDYGAEFLDEYGKFIEYCSKNESTQCQPIKNIFVCGDFEYAKKITEVIIDNGNITNNVRLSNVWTNALDIEKNTPDIPYEKSLGFASSIGAALLNISI